MKLGMKALLILAVVETAKYEAVGMTISFNGEGFKPLISMHSSRSAAAKIDKKSNGKYVNNSIAIGPYSIPIFSLYGKRRNCMTGVQYATTAMYWDTFADT